MFRYFAEDRDLLLPKEQRAEYVKNRYIEQKSILQYPFGKPKSAPRILLIGESFSQDLFNAIYEANVLPLQNIDLRTLLIYYTCGFYRGSEDVWTAFVQETKDAVQVCSEISKNSERFYTLLDARINEADIVLVARSWQSWESDRLLETLRNFSFPPSTRIIVVGTKRFAFDLEKDAKSYVGIPLVEKLKIRKDIAGGDISFNASMREKLKAASVEFIDLHELICGKDADTCPIFTDGGLLISYDGWHLTQAGAKFLGQKLAAHPVFQSLNKEIAQQFNGMTQ